MVQGHTNRELVNLGRQLDLSEITIFQDVKIAWSVLCIGMKLYNKWPPFLTYIFIGEKYWVIEPIARAHTK